MEVTSNPMNKTVRYLLGLLLTVLTVLFPTAMVVGRLISGVHWLTDIVGAVLLSGGLFCVYRAAVLLCYEREC